MFALELLVSIPFAIAADLAEIPFELADFCGGEEDAALIQGSYDRLEHIHNDLADASAAILSAQTAIINNANTNTTNIIRDGGGRGAEVLASQPRATIRPASIAPLAREGSWTSSTW